MNSDFKDLLSLLAQHEVKFFVVGGYTVMLYGEPRHTKDIAIAIESDNLLRFSIGVLPDEKSEIRSLLR